MVTGYSYSIFIFFMSHHLIFSFTCIVHPDIKLSRIPVQSLEQGLFKVPLSLKTKYIYIYISFKMKLYYNLHHSWHSWLTQEAQFFVLFLLPSHIKALQQALWESIYGQKLKQTDWDWPLITISINRLWYWQAWML